jgi:hypothetical protein
MYAKDKGKRGKDVGRRSVACKGFAFIARDTSWEESVHNGRVQKRWIVGHYPSVLAQAGFSHARRRPMNRPAADVDP